METQSLVGALIMIWQSTWHHVPKKIIVIVTVWGNMKCHRLMNVLYFQVHNSIWCLFTDQNIITPGYHYKLVCFFLHFIILTLYLPFKLYVFWVKTFLFLFTYLLLWHKSMCVVIQVLTTGSCIIFIPANYLYYLYITEYSVHKNSIS